jgi:hypothetical protein
MAMSSVGVRPSQELPHPSTTATPPCPALLVTQWPLCLVAGASMHACNVLCFSGLAAGGPLSWIVCKL